MPLRVPVGNKDVRRPGRLFTPEVAMYEYKARAVSITDGDTCVLSIDLGCYVYIERKCRLKGVNTPELHGPDSERAKKAKDRLAELIAAQDLLIKTTLDKSEKYGRLLVEIWNPADMSMSVNKRLIKEGLAEEYMV